MMIAGKWSMLDCLRALIPRSVILLTVSCILGACANAPPLACHQLARGIRYSDYYAAFCQTDADLSACERRWIELYGDGRQATFWREYARSRVLLETSAVRAPPLLAGNVAVYIEHAVPNRAVITARVEAALAALGARVSVIDTPCEGGPCLIVASGGLSGLDGISDTPIDRLFGPLHLPAQPRRRLSASQKARPYSLAWPCARCAFSVGSEGSSSSATLPLEVGLRT